MAFSMSLLLSLLLIVGGVVGQTATITTNATCLAAYGWMDNSLGQSPCLVTAYLGAVCNNGAYEVDALTGDSSAEYGVPSNGGNACICSGVFYTVAQACAICQGKSATGWNYFKTNCTASYAVNGYPFNAPGTVIPTWADLDVTTFGVFNAAQASSYALGPSAAITPGLTTSVSSTSATPTPTPTPTPSPTPTPTPAPSSSTPIGPIVGGVVGGVAAIVFGALALWWYFAVYKKRNADGAEPTAGRSSIDGEQVMRTSPASPPPPSSHLSPVGGYNMGGYMPQPQPPTMSPTATSRASLVGGMGGQQWSDQSSSAYSPHQQASSQWSPYDPAQNYGYNVQNPGPVQPPDMRMMESDRFSPPPQYPAQNMGSAYPTGKH